MASSRSMTEARGRCVGQICENPIKDSPTVPCTGKKIYDGEQVIIGRDPNKCNYVVYDPTVSCKHLRIYTIIVDQDDVSGVPPLVYAEDLSRNGTYWNNALMGKGRGGFLLSDNDVLQISSRINLVFKQHIQGLVELIDDIQEREIQFHHKYIISNRTLGSGAFGEVKMAIDRSSKTQLACKIVDLRKLNVKKCTSADKEEYHSSAHKGNYAGQHQGMNTSAKRQKARNTREDKIRLYRREAQILSRLNHPNIIGLEKVYVTNNTLYILLELVTGGDLFSYLESKGGKLQEVEAAVIIRQILLAVQHLHDHGIAHRDLKPENILLSSASEGCRVVLTDFGAAKTFDEEQRRMMTSVGTKEYLAPEILRTRRGYTKAIDLWSIGCVAVVLLTGGSPFRNGLTGEYSQDLAESADLSELDQDDEWKQVSCRPKDFVSKLLIKDDNQRMTADQALSHGWFTHNVYRNEFDELYKRTIRGWRPRVPKEPVIQELNGASRKVISEIDSSEVERKSRKRPLTPIDPPYIPYPRKLSRILMPNVRRRPRSSFGEEVVAAIEQKWSSSPRALRSSQFPSVRADSSTLKVMSNLRNDVSSEASPKLGLSGDSLKNYTRMASFKPLISQSKETKSTASNTSHLSNTARVASRTSETSGNRDALEQSTHRRLNYSASKGVISQDLTTPKDALGNRTYKITEGLPSSSAREVDVPVASPKPAKAARRPFSPEAWRPSLYVSKCSKNLPSLVAVKAQAGPKTSVSDESNFEYDIQPVTEDSDKERAITCRDMDFETPQRREVVAGEEPCSATKMAKLNSPCWSRRRSRSTPNGGDVWMPPRLAHGSKRRVSSIFDLQEDEDECDGLILTGAS